MTTTRIDEARCTRCGICETVCPVRAIAAGESGVPVIVPERTPLCIACGHCEAFCPSGALVRGAEPCDEARVVSSMVLGPYLKSRRSVRHYRDEPVPRETIEAILDVARYAPSGGNRQPVGWLVVHDPAEVRRLAGITVAWMRAELESRAPLMPPPVLEPLIAAWDRGGDPICRGAPHLLVAHMPDASAFVDGIIAVTWADAIAPSHGVGTCWAGFLMIAAARWSPLADALALPPGRVPAHALMCGFPKYAPTRIPERKPLELTWR
jgi:nitroreductase/NAD-dependent dihydropyrimidine dehydrogenase PreA subunit